ncbi:unnamed protein product [Mucor hiemalis]
MANSSPKKEKKDKKDKKEKKDKKDKKDKKGKKKELGEAVEPSKYSDEYLDSERFKPVPNPAFNPALTSPLTSPAASIKSGSIDEKWVISSKRKSDSLPAVQISNGQPQNESSGPLTPAELQGFAASKYVPSGGYAHLDPTKHENAYSAFDQLKRLSLGDKESVSQSAAPTTQKSPSSQQKTPPPQQQQQRAVQPQQQQRSPQSQQTRSPSNQQQKPPTQSPSQSQTQQRPPMGQSRPSRLEDGVPVLKYTRALWNYTAQVKMEYFFTYRSRYTNTSY